MVVTKKSRIPRVCDVLPCETDMWMTSRCMNSVEVRGSSIGTCLNYGVATLNPGTPIQMCRGTFPADPLFTLSRWKFDRKGSPSPDFLFIFSVLQILVSFPPSFLSPHTFRPFSINRSGLIHFGRSALSSFLVARLLSSKTPGMNYIPHVPPSFATASEHVLTPYLLLAPSRLIHHVFLTTRTPRQGGGAEAGSS